MNFFQHTDEFSTFTQNVFNWLKSTWWWQIATLRLCRKGQCRLKPLSVPVQCIHAQTNNTSCLNYGNIHNSSVLIITEPAIHNRLCADRWKETGNSLEILCASDGANWSWSRRLNEGFYYRFPWFIWQVEADYSTYTDLTKQTPTEATKNQQGEFSDVGTTIICWQKSI